MILNIYEQYNADEGCHERWKRWEQHRNTLHSVLNEQIFSSAGIKDAVILGAGRCEDVDLRRLLKHVESLTLVDYDYNSMEKALERQQLSRQEKEKIILEGNIEFTGFYGEDFVTETLDKIKRKENPESVVQFVKKHLSSVKDSLGELLDNRPYSLVISGAVHSQLIVPFTQIAAFDSEYTDRLMQEAAPIANILAEDYNRSLLSLVKEGGWLFSYFDVMELSERNQMLAYEDMIGGLIAQEEYDKIDAFFLQGGGVAGARQGYNHLYELVKQYEPYKKCWIWPFRDNKKYYIRSLCFKLTSC
ncbi:hypothetical protein [Aminipila luticellarii]|uniref:Class I SAM-dependent methyltransferase n=1 Tax=Aminipila luticellarii TaxID=2507160 RepID=A0A410PXH0_9FIRM|nr:hypothetical protein [Aminipila luticellarii]QAT43629.1 hypothetical protein EQM06_10585 [Aminipila luticellarii]